MTTHQQSNENFLGTLTDLFGGVVEIQHDNDRPENVTENDMRFLQEDEIIYDFDDGLFFAREREIRYGLGYDFERLRELFDGTANINARKGHVKLMAELLANGADIEYRDGLGRTPLFYVVQSNLGEWYYDIDYFDWVWKQDAVQFLLESGANIHAHDNAGTTVLDLRHRNETYRCGQTVAASG